MKIKSFIVLLTLSVVFISCSSEKSKNSSSQGMTTMEQNMTEADTVAIQNAINTYFTYWENEQYYDAAAMLYHPNPDEQAGEPVLYTNEEMDAMVKMMQSLPIVGHRIGYIKIHESFCNEVMCHLILVRGDKNTPNIETKYYIKPICYLGSWMLTVADTESGNNTFVDGSDADSMEKQLRSYDKLKAKQKQN